MKSSKDFKSLDKAALTTELTDLLRTHFALRMQHATQQLSNYRQLRMVKKDIARVKTLLTQKAI